MKKTILERIISLVREEMMTTHSTAGKPGFSSEAPAKGPTAGFDPVIDKKIEKRKRPRYIWTKGIRKRWKDSGKS